MRVPAPTVLCLGLLFALPVRADGLFDFFTFKTPQELGGFLLASFPPGTEKIVVQRLVEEGGAHVTVQPFDPKTETYIYDVNLCKKYVWRWNISVTYDAEDKTQAMYLYDANLYLPDQKYVRPDPDIAIKREGAVRPKTYKMELTQPEAPLGEGSLTYLLKDGDGDLKTTDDQVAVGSMPERADPSGLGTLTVLNDIPLWQSPYSPEKIPAVMHPECGE